MMLKKLYRKVFPLKSVIRKTIEDLREFITIQTSTLSAQTDHKVDVLKDQLVDKVDKIVIQNDGLSTKLDGHRESVITSTQLIAADINAGIFGYLTPIRVDVSKQWELMNEINKNLQTLQNEVKASKVEMSRIKSMLEHSQSISLSKIEDSLEQIKSAISGNVGEVKIAGNNDLNAAAIHSSDQ